MVSQSVKWIQMQALVMESLRTTIQVDGEMDETNEPIESIRSKLAQLCHAITLPPEHLSKSRQHETITGYEDA